MFTKLKYFTLGIIMATLINAGITFAEDEYFQLKRVDYPIFINGVETNLESLIFNYEGSTYIPLRKIAEITGSNVIWNNNLKSVIITNAVKEVIKEVPVEKLVYVTPKVTPTPTSTPISPITIIETSSGKYEGTIINTKLEGFGKYTWSNGDYYVGEFKNGLMNGKGTTFMADGSIASGNYSNGRSNGYSVYVSSKGAVRGYWSNEVLNNKQIAIFGSVIDEDTNTNNAPVSDVQSTQSSNIALYTLLKERLDKQLAADIKTEENNCTFKINTMRESLNGRGILDSSMSTNYESSFIQEKDENIKRLKDKYESDLEILKNLYGIQ